MDVFLLNVKCHCVMSVFLVRVLFLGQEARETIMIKNNKR